MAKSNNPRFTSPAGTAVWPKLNEPDTKFDADGVYHTKLAFDADDSSAAALVAKLEKVRDDFFDATVQRLIDEKKAGKAKNLKKLEVVKAEVDDETGDETGRIILVAKLKSKGSSKDGKTWTNKLDYFNAKGVQLKNPPRIGSGSKLKLNFEAKPYLRETDGVVGVSLRLNGVQILTLVSGGARTAADYGFGEEDGDDIGDVDTTTGGDDAPFDADTDADHDDI